MHKSAKPSRQYYIMLKQNKRLIQLSVQIRRKMVNKVKDKILRFYKSFVRLQLEYYIQVVIARNMTWKNLRKSSNRTRARCFNVTECLYNTIPFIYSEALCSGLQSIIMSCEDRLKRCGLTTLDRKRGRRDMIQAGPSVEKYLWKRSSVQCERFLNEHSTRELGTHVK